MSKETEGSSSVVVTLRSDVRGADVEAVRSIVEATGFFHPYETAIAVELVEERLARGAASGYEFVFADRAGVTVGYTCYGLIGCTQASYDLYWIAVHPSCQGTGLGRLLMQSTEQAIARRGGQRIYLETSDRPLYQPTRGFYVRCGYEQEARLKDFYAPGDHKVIFSKPIPAG